MNFHGVEKFQLLTLSQILLKASSGCCPHKRKLGSKNKKTKKQKKNGIV